MKNIQIIITESQGDFEDSVTDLSPVTHNVFYGYILADNYSLLRAAFEFQGVFAVKFITKDVLRVADDKTWTILWWLDVIDTEIQKV